MGWCSKNDMSDEQAIALSDQILASYEDGSPESVQLFADLTTEAMLHMTSEQWQEFEQAIRQA